MHVDNALSWSNHVDTLCKKLCSGLLVLRNIVKVARESVALSVYYALLHSHISYGKSLWGSCSQSDTERVFKLQKRAVRYVCGLRAGDSCAPYFQSLEILTVPSLYALEVCLLAKQRKIDLPKLGDNHTYCTRNSFRITNHRTARFEMKPS